MFQVANVIIDNIINSNFASLMPKSQQIGLLSTFLPCAHLPNALLSQPHLIGKHVILVLLYWPSL